MIVDTSAIVAILFDEPEAERFQELIGSDPAPRMSVASFFEAAMVVENRGGAAVGQRLDAYIDVAQIELVPVTVEQAQGARRVWRRFGKGNHRANLNFGDCLAYALAEAAGEPLLYKGGDFALTDITPADR